MSDVFIEQIKQTRTSVFDSRGYHANYKGKGEGRGRGTNIR